MVDAQGPDGAPVGDAQPEAEASLPLCGDGRVDPGEVCDDGNTLDGDGCRGDCLSDETCGNGILDPGEDCDLGLLNSDAPGAVCRSDCSLPRCGDGIVDDIRGETCDEGPGNSDAPNSSCRTSCRGQRCGDGILDDALGEVCDDGNTLDGDGCRGDCLSDETCGNGLVDLTVGEICDDGNAQPGDGCHQCLPSETQINLTVASYQNLSCVVAAPDGSMAVVWRSTDTRAQRFAPDGSRAGVPCRLDGISRAESCALTDAGELQVLDRALSGLLLHRYDPWGVALGEPCRVTDPTEAEPYAAAMTPGAPGALVVAWTHGQASNQLTGIRARILSTDGAPMSEPLWVTEEGGLHVGLGAESGGRFLVSWIVIVDEVDHIYAQWHSPDGTPEAPAFLVDLAPGPYPDARARSSLVSVAPDGHAVVAWTVWVESPRSRVIFAQRLGPSGALLGAPVEVSTYPFLDQTQTGLAMADDGSFAVGMIGFGLDGDSYRVRYSLVDPLGTPFVLSEALGSIVAGRQRRTRVASLPEGSYLFAWSSNDDADDREDVYALRLNALGEPMYLEPWGDP